MGKNPRTPNRTLRRIREGELRFTRVAFAEALARKAYELGDDLEPGERYVARLESGEIRWPSPAYRRALEALCGHSMAELGFAEPAQRTAYLVPATLAGHGLGADLADIDWPTWFGFRLAQLIGLVDGWCYQKGQVSALQGILAQEVTMFSAAAPPPGEPDRAAFEQSRRQALTTLAALPLGFATTGLLGSSTWAIQESFLSQCTASLTACWQLLGGSDLKVVDHVLTNYLVPLEGLAHQHSKYQQTAAMLASQAHRMRAIVALHLKQIALDEHHAREAVRYANLASDVSAEVLAFSSLVQAYFSLGQAYFYDSNPVQALTTFERALALEGRMLPQQRSRLHAELAAVYGQLGREQEALRSAGWAEKIFPDHPQDDPNYLYMELTPAVLGLKQGLAYLALAEQYEGRGYERQAADVLGRIDQAETVAISDRIRYEIANHQARAAVLLDDLDAFELYIHRGLDGVVLLGSRQRLREAQQAWQMAMHRWPNERRLMVVTERLQLTAGNGGEPG
jgi:tetratricopeptide (TPR) repeat protein